MYPTLLHIASDATKTIWSIDLRIVAAAALLGALLMAVLWKPSLGRKQRSRLVALAAWSLAFLAVLPSVVPYDHMMSETHTATENHGEIHAKHCHEGPATCSDAPVSAGPGQLMFSQPLLPSVDLTSAPLVDVLVYLEDTAVPPGAPPPRA
jgi:hypothetical protein